MIDFSFVVSIFVESWLLAVIVFAKSRMRCLLIKREKMLIFSGLHLFYRDLASVDMMSYQNC